MRFVLSKKNILFFTLISFSGAAGNILSEALPPISQATQVLNWDRVLATYDAYVDCPTFDNAKAFLAALPTDRINETVGETDQALKHIFSADSFPVLWEEATSGDKSAIEIYFRLLNVSDGFDTELLLSTLGWLVRNHPKLFLEALGTYKDVGYVKKFGYPVTFIGAGHNVHLYARKHILEKRIEALETVKDPKYNEIKEACINKLRETLKKLPQ